METNTTSAETRTWLRISTTILCILAMLPTPALLLFPSAAMDFFATLPSPFNVPFMAFMLALVTSFGLMNLGSTFLTNMPWKLRAPSTDRYVPKRGQKEPTP